MIKIGIPQPPRLDGMPRKIKINKCSDSSYWYKDLVGKVIMIERIDGYGYWGREGGIYNCINFVRFEDATLLPLEN